MQPCCQSSWTSVDIICHPSWFALRKNFCLMCAAYVFLSLKNRYISLLMVAKIAHNVFVPWHTQQSIAAVSLRKFQQSTGSVLESTGEENCIEEPQALLHVLFISKWDMWSFCMDFIPQIALTGRCWRWQSTIGKNLRPPRWNSTGGRSQDCISGRVTNSIFCFLFYKRSFSMGKEKMDGTSCGNF